MGEVQDGAEGTVREAWHPYQRVCGFESQIKVENLEQKFRDTLDTRATFWVKNQLAEDEDEEDDVPEYEMTFSLRSTVEEVKEKIREAEGMEPTEPLKLIYADTMMKDGDTLLLHDTLIEKQRKKFPPPYAGVLWIAAPGHILPSSSKKARSYYKNEDAAKMIFHRLSGNSNN